MPNPTGDDRRMAELIADYDWASTPLGPIASWPQSQKTAVDIMLASGHAMQLAWGPERTVLYNDAYAPMLGDRHPAALGVPFSEAWPEIWEEIKPLVDRVFAGQTVRFEDMPLVMTRSGYPEDTWWTFSYSPVRNEPGEVAGLLNVTMEATARMRAARAEAAVREREQQFRALATAGANMIYRMSPDWRVMYRLDGRGVLKDASDPTERWPEVYIPEEDRQPVLAAIEDAVRDKTLFELEHRVCLANGGIGWVHSRAVPIIGADGEITEWLGAGTDVTERREAAEKLRESEQRQRFLLELSDVLRPLSDPAEILTAAVGRLGEQLGVMRAAYYEVEADQNTFALMAEWENGAPPLAERMLLSEYGPDVRDGYRAGRTLVCRDTEREAPSEDHRMAYRAIQLRAWVGVPLVRDGQLLTLVGVHSRTPRTWTPAEVRLVEDVADRTWAAVERARAEAAQRESEERLRQFGEASQDVLWIRDAETLQWHYLTPAFEAIYGFTRDEALAGNNYRSWMDLIVPEDRKHVSENIRRVRNGEHVTFDYRIRRPADGLIRWLRNTDFPIRDKSGNVALIGGIGHDCTELREAELRLETLVQGIPQLVWRAVDGGRWTWASPQWEVYSGLTVADSVNWGWLDALHLDDRPRARLAWARSKERSGFEVEYRVRRAERHEYRWFQTRATPVRDDTGAIIEWLGTSTDIHDLRELQERQRVLVAELQHRTRNLMGVVRAMADRTGEASADFADFRDRFRDRLEALVRVQGLLSRLNETDRVAFDELIRNELAAMDGAVDRVTLDGPAGIRLRSSMVQTLAMALHELATNALKYGALGQPGGQLAISWRMASPDTRGRPRLHIDWRESGIKMPPAGAAPQGSGQGRELIEEALPYQLDAETSFELGPDGVHCTITLPVSAGNMTEPAHD